jgi:hypothetical protein
MKSAIGLSVCDHALSAFVFLVGTLEITGGIFAKIVVVDEFLAGILRRVDVNHLHLAQISFLQQFQRIQVIAFDKQVLRAVKIYAFLTTGTQGFRYRCVSPHLTHAINTHLKTICYDIENLRVALHLKK